VGSGAPALGVGISLVASVDILNFKFEKEFLVSVDLSLEGRRMK
jgi:hypothetical protein